MKITDFTCERLTKEVNEALKQFGTYTLKGKGLEKIYE